MVRNHIIAQRPNMGRHIWWRFGANNAYVWRMSARDDGLYPIYLNVKLTVKNMLDAPITEMRRAG